MIRAVKVIMAIFGSVLILEGLLDVVMPAQRASMFEPGGSSASVLFYMTILGATWVAAGIWVVAASRDPARHVSAVKFVITLPTLLSMALIFSILRGYVGLGQVIIELALDAFFALSLLALYPWRRRSGAGLAGAGRQ